ncbi:hypothetical protein A2U01_0112611, partial [Trifolium medium]|nr:hypothetical protein [Trifolium medium]
MKEEEKEEAGGDLKRSERLREESVFVKNLSVSASPNSFFF